MRNYYIFLILLLPFCFVSCQDKDEDEKPTPSNTKAMLKGRWNKVTLVSITYEKGTKSIIREFNTTYGDGDYEEFTDTEFFQYQDNRKFFSLPYEVVDEKTIKTHLVGQDSETLEIKELTPTRLVYYFESTTNTGDKATFLVTNSR